MSLPKPEAGLVIRYSYLWLHEHREGREEGTKDRPCAIVLAARDQDGETKVLVVPVTLSPPDDVAAALELPPTIRRHLGLDTERSWVVLSESNLFDWPGPDLRRVGDRDDSSVAYGFLPPRFFAELRRRFLALEAAARSRQVQRTE
ncbi:MAG: hypothetical protein P4M09_24600 [Devosia sp.]|nr:hypothetical protein [Devosia sp.]